MKVSRWSKKVNGMTVDSSLEDMKMYQSEKKKILACGHIYYSNRIKYLYDATKDIEGTELIILCENGDITYSRMERDQIPYLSSNEKRKIKFFIVPDIFIKDSFHEFQNVDVNWKRRLHIYTTAYLREAAKNLKKRHWNMGKGYPENFVYEAERYINGMLDVLNPEIVIIWNQFHAFHHIMGAICKRRGIQIIYYEFGSLPGTYALERLGQMGESYPAQYSQEFKNLPVTKEELQQAEKVWEFLKTSKLNRKEQPVNDDLNILKKRLKPGRPIIFFAGQNDYEAGICPYTSNTKKNHSPIFESSDEAAIELASICKKNDWNFVYKRHPLVSKFVPIEKISVKMPDNILMFDNLDISTIIETADVTVTILSQVGYVSTILKRPTIMLGYMQLKGKGCTYEVFEKRNVESTIRQALQEGFTKDQESAFIKHIAQLNKYYLFNDPCVEREIYYGQDIEQCTKFFLECLNEAAVKKYENNEVCTQRKVLKNIRAVLKGRSIWRSIYDSRPIDLGIDRIIIIPEENRKTQYYAMLYLDKFLERVEKKNAIIITDSQLVCDTIGLFTKRMKYVTKISKKNMDALLKYQIVFGNVEIATIASLERYTGRLCEGLFGKEEISTEELMAVGVYDLSYFYHDQNKRVNDIGNIYLQLYFPEIFGGKMNRKIDMSQRVRLKKEMVSKRGIINFIISDNIAHLSLYLNKVGKCKNEVGIVIPREYAPEKETIVMANSNVGQNYIVIIKNNGEIWFNLHDEKQCAIVLDCTWII